LVLAHTRNGTNFQFLISNSEAGWPNDSSSSNGGCFSSWFDHNPMAASIDKNGGGSSSWFK
jgi:hypothetical protein